MQTVRTLPRIKVPNLSYSRIFSDTPEESLRLRTLVMLAVLWVALSLNWLTGAPWRGILKKCVNGQAVYPLSEQDGLKAQERRYTAYGKEKH